ncbi:MAG: hypothetical protein ACKOTB_07270 [Planctomycetia bacterium]
MGVCLAALWAALAPSLLTAAPPTCLQDERRYAVFDALFLQRNNAAIDRPVVVSSANPSLPVLSANDPQSTIGTGARIVYGTYGAENVGWEAGYLGIWGMHAHRTVTDPGASLEAPNTLFASQTGLNNATLAGMTENASINSAEVNLVLHEYDGGFNRRSGRPAQRCDGYDGGHVDWIGGFRWANLQDSAVLAMAPGTAPVPSSDTATTSSNLFAGQVGTRGRMQFEHWGVEGWMKIGIAGTALSQSQSLVDALSPKPFRTPQSADTAGMGMIADMNLSAIYRFNDVWGLRAGYNLMWLTGVALAADQWDFSPTQSGGTGINGSGSIFLSGANLGLEARW